MKKQNIRTVPYRRKREGRTDYRGRLNALKSGKIRLVVRKSNKHIIAQLIRYEPSGDKIIASASSSEIKKIAPELTTGSIPSAYLIGLLIGKKSKESKVSEAILDIGLQDKGECLFAVLKGAVEAGLNIPHEEDILPSEDRVNGKHIEEYRKISLKQSIESAKKLLGA